MDPQRVCFGCFQEKEKGMICPHCGFDENAEQPFLALPLGTIIGGRYITGRVLGIGGFGITYLGFDLTLELKVAVKEYMPSGMATRGPDRYTVSLTAGNESDYRAGEDKFLSEARILAKLQNTPNIVSVQNYFRENNTAYFVMDYIEGMSLKEYLERRGGRLSFAQTLTILKPVMNALCKVHERNLMHRDISPDNIYITAEGESMLLDFGAARSSMGGSKSVSVILKHGYAPEEQYSSHGDQGPWTDVYAMGATFYHCLTGQVPPDAIERIHNDRLVKPSALGSDIPPDAELALLKALSVRVEDRFPDMRSLINAISGGTDARVSVEDRIADNLSRKAASDPGVTAAVSGTGGGAPGSETKTASSGSALTKLWNEHRVPVIAGLAALVLLCVLIPVIAVTAGKNRNTAPEPAIGDGGGGTPIVSTGDTGTISIGTPGGGSSGTGSSADTGNSGQGSTETEPPSTTPGTGSGGAGGTSIAGAEVYTNPTGSFSIALPEGFAANVEEDGSVTIINKEQGGSLGISFEELVFGCFALYDENSFEANDIAILDTLATNAGIEEHEWLNGTFLTVGGRPAYVYLFSSTYGDGSKGNGFIAGIKGNEDDGLWLISSSWPEGNSTLAAQIPEMIDSFRVLGSGTDLYQTVTDDSVDFRFMCARELTENGKIEVNGPGAHANPSITVYVDSQNAWNQVLVQNASLLGKNAEEALEALDEIILANYTGAAANTTNTYARPDSTAVWTVKDYTAKLDDNTALTIYAGAADFDDRTYCIFGVGDVWHITDVESVYNQMMFSLDPL